MSRRRNYGLQRTAMNHTTTRDHASRQALLDATLDLIDEVGVDKVRVTAVVERAGLTTGSLYWFFKNREALINSALAERYIRKMREMLDETTARARAGAVVPSEAAFGVADLTEEGRAEARAERIRVLAAAIDNPDLTLRVAELQRELIGQLADLVRVGQEHGVIRSDVNPHATAVMIHATTVGLAIVDLAPDLMPKQSDWIALNTIVVNALRV